MSEEISKWSNTQAVREVECPRCHSKPGIYCKTPSGVPAPSTHGERSGAYREKIGPEEWEKRHTASMASSATLQKGRVDLIIRDTGKVGAVGKGNVESGLTRWRQ
jgi:hypothetical protein